jgi:8-oxo-dGTP pyrophosphatase MutT (NUDIX family)
MTIALAGFRRHLAACRNAVLPGERVPLRLGTETVGWPRPDLAKAFAAAAKLTLDPDAGVTLPSARAAELPVLAEGLSRDGWFRWRREAFDVRAAEDSPVLSHIDRGALPKFGIYAEGVHVNGLVRRADGLHVWVAHRAADKLLDPEKLDHIVAGGINAGMGPDDTLIKEAAEEAAISAELADYALSVGRICYAMERAEGLRRDLIHCYDLDLPEDFEPQPVDGEVSSFALWPIARAMEAVAETDDFKFNVTLVLIDLFLREGLLGDGTEARGLREALDDPKGLAI